MLLASRYTGVQNYNKVLVSKNAVIPLAVNLGCYQKQSYIVT